MNRLVSFAMAWVVLGTMVAVAQPGSITIKASKKSAGSRDGGNITAGKNIRVSEHDIYYVFDFRSMSATPRENLRVEWVVLVETMKGKLRTASEGSETISLSSGQAATVETPLITLKAESGPKGKTFKGEIEGVGVRVTDAAGSLVGELYEPASNRKLIDDAFNGEIRKRKQP